MSDYQELNERYLQVRNRLLYHFQCGYCRLEEDEVELLERAADFLDTNYHAAIAEYDELEDHREFLKDCKKNLIDPVFRKNMINFKVKKERENDGH